MKHEEAIKELKIRYELGRAGFMKDIPEYVEALGMGIEALKQQSIFEQAKWENEILKTRCYAFCKGLFCGSCKFECEYKDEEMEE